MYNRGIPEYDRLDADRWMEATWMAKKNAMMSNAGMSASDAAAYATGHVLVNLSVVISTMPLVISCLTITEN